MSDKGFELVRVPLVEATIEVRFPGEAQIDAVRGTFQRAVAPELPLLFVPSVQSGDSPALMPYRFQSSDGTRILALALHSLAYTVKQYPGWASFKQDFLDYWSKLTELVVPQQINRVGTRFINRFNAGYRSDLAAEGLPDYLETLMRTECSFYRAAVDFRRRETRLLVNVHRPEDEDSLLLDYDAYTSSSSHDSLKETLDRLHAEAEGEFLIALHQDLRDKLSEPKAEGPR